MAEKKYSIIYVDDEPSNVRVFKTIFRRYYNVFLAESGAEGLEVLEKNTIHLIITDQRMPGMTGVEFLKKLKINWPDIPCVLLTAFTDHEVVKEAVNRVGIFRYINKPFDHDDMKSLIEHALESYQLKIDLRKSKKKEKESQEKLSKIVETALDAIITIDDQHNIIMANEATGKMFGYEVSELLNKPLNLLIPKGIRQGHGKHIEEFASSKITSKYMGSELVIRGVNSSGKLFPIETALSKMKVGGKIYFNAIVRNISERAKMEQELRNSEEKFKGVFNSIVDIFSRVKNDGTVEMLSPSVYEILGYKAEELIGKKAINYYVNPIDRERLILLIKDTGYCNNFEAPVYTKDGSIKHLSINAKIYNDKNGNQVGIESLVRDITNKKLAEDKLATSADLLKESQRLAHLGHITVDMATNEMEWSDEIYRLYGIGPDEIPDMEYILGLIHPDDLDNVKEGLNLAMKQVKDYNIEHRIIRANNGEEIWVHAQANMKFDKDGNPESLIGTVLDITAKKRDEQALRQREEEFRSIYESSYSGIPLVNHQGRFLRTNKRFREMFGYSDLELEKLTIADLTHPDDKERSLKKFKKIVSGKISHFEIEKKYLKKNGGEFICNTAVTAPAGPDGKPLFFTAMITDITEQKSMEEKVKQSEEDFRSLAESSPIFILKVNKNHIINYINSVSDGVNKEDVIGSSLFEFVPKSDKERVRKLIDGVFRSKKPDQYEILTKDDKGKETWYSTIVGPIIKERKVENVLLLSSDISEKKEAEIKINQLNENLEKRVVERTIELENAQIELALSLEKEKELGELKSRFVATASHQFRTPLTVIQSNIGLLDMQLEMLDKELKPKFGKVAGRIQSEVKRMTALMDEVLILGKINAGSIKPKLKPVDIVALCMEVASNYNAIQEDGRKFKFSVNGKPVNFKLDPKLLEHTISNLASNAFKYSTGKPSPSLTISFEAKGVQISVKDSGIGIPANDIKHLFEPFFRASNVEEVSGTGLGTAIIKEYVELNKGTIDVKSKIKSGSEFIIEFKKPQV